MPLSKASRTIRRSRSFRRPFQDVRTVGRPIEADLT